MAKSKHLRQIVSKYTDDELKAVLGTMPDTEIAKLLDVSTTTIKYHRFRLSIPAFGKEKHRWILGGQIKEYVAYYNEHTVEEVAEKYNTTVCYITWLTTRFRQLGYNIEYKRWNKNKKESQRN